MPGKVKVKIVAGRNLPVMDRSNDTTDAYVEVKLGTTTFKTDVCRKSLNPQWNSEWFRFEMDDLELQDEPLQIRLMDHDTYSANDAIGKVYLDLNPLLLTSSKGTSASALYSSAKLISGWIPVYDTMHGIRGEVNLVVKVELFSDLNKFRQSSCGVMFFFTQAVPDGYFAHSIHGFVEELVVNDDPEYQWIDKIRTPRASNEARQTLFSKLSGEVQRRVGLKALELGGNAVIGYRQCFDLEGESGIVVRGIGTAATLIKQYESQLSPGVSDVGAGPREFQSLDDGLLLPFSSHPTILSKSSRSKCTGSRVPFFTYYSMQENSFLPRIGPHRSFMHSRAPFSSSSASVSTPFTKLKCTTASSSNNYSTSVPTSTSSSFTTTSSAFKNLLQAVSGRYESHHRSHSDTSVVVRPVASEPAGMGKPSHPNVRIMSRPTSLVERSDPIEIIQPVVKVKSIEVGIAEEDESKVQFHAGGESLSSSSGKEVEFKVDDADDDADDDDDEERMKFSEKENKFYFLIGRRAKGSKKKDRYSKSSLLKRASMNFADSKRLLSSNGKSNREKLTDEIAKYFKRKKLLGAVEKDDSSSLSESASPYRQVRSSIFRRRQKGRLIRCNSESFSLGETSVDSLPSIQSDMAFDPRDDTDNSLESLPTQLQNSPARRPLSASLVMDKSRESSLPTEAVRTLTEVEESGRACSHGRDGDNKNVSHGPIVADSESTARVIHAVKDLGYDVNKPVKLYISSADALLVCDPAMKMGRRDVKNDDEAHNINSSINASHSGKKISLSEQIIMDDDEPCGSSSGPKSVTINADITSNKKSYDCLNDYRKQQQVGQEHKSPAKIVRQATSVASSSNWSATTRSTTSSMISYDRSSTSSGLGYCSSSGRNSDNNLRSSPSVRIIPPEKSTIEEPELQLLGPDGAKPSVGVSSDSFRVAKEEEQRSLSVSVSKTCATDMSDNSSSTTQNLPQLTSGKDSIDIINDSKNRDVQAKSLLHGERCALQNESDRPQQQQSCRARKASGDPSGPPKVLSSSCSCSVITTTSTTMTTVESSSNTCANVTNTTTTTTCTSTATVATDANVDMSLSSLKNASSTNMPPPPLPTVSKSTSANATTNGTTAFITTSRQPNIISGNNIPNDNNTLAASQPKQPAQPGQKMGVPITNSFLNRRSSESDLSTPPKPVSTNATTVTTVLASSSHGKTLTFAPMPPRRLITADHFEMLEYPFITLNQLPPGFIQHIGGTVSARSVKLLERISNLDEPESRDSWWTEIRMEIRSHARSIGCNVVLGYEEQTTMCDDVCVLSASGTAAVLSGTGETCEITIPSVMKVPGSDPCACIRVEKEKTQSSRTESVSSQHNTCTKCSTKPKHSSSESSESTCSLCHIPYSESSVPFPVKMSRCLLCKKGKVPDILLATIDLPVGLQCYGKSCLIQAQVFRPKKDCKGEISAKEVSDSLPFLEYELHRRLINKLKVRGMNAIFALQVQICLGEKMMVGLATGTAVFVSCLPPPSVPKISAGNLKTDSQKVVQFQKVVQEVYERNREVYDLKNTVPTNVANGNQSVSSDGEDSDEDLPDIDLATGNKDTYVLEVDDAEDIDIIQVLIDPSPELGFYMNNINFLHGFENYRVASQQMFTQVWRCRISPLITLRQFTNYFDKLLQAVAFKLRRISPCVLSKLRYRVELPEQDEIQLSIIGLAVQIEECKGVIAVEAPKGTNGAEMQEPAEPEMLGSPSHKSPPIAICSTSAPNSAGVSNTADVSLLLTPNPSVASAPANSASPGSPGAALQQAGYMGTTPKSKAYPRAVQLLSKPKCIDITPLPHIPGAKIDKYLGNLNFFFIRETTSIRENGGLSGFVHSFVAEILAIVRAHVAALGGNAMVSYFMTELALLHNPHKNQGQCLVNVGGDVVYAIHSNSM